VNFLIPHSFNPRSPRDTDCPPYFYNNGYEPRWPLYRVFADYTSRLSGLLTGGRHVAPVALLTPGQSAHVGKRVLPAQMSEVLQDALYDCDWIPYEVFENDMTLAGRELKLRAEAYRILVVPPVEVIPQATLAKAKDFFDRGGVVVAHGFLPSKSATLGASAAQIAQMREAIWGVPTPGLTVCKISAAGGRSYLLPEAPTPEQLQQVLAGDAGVHPTLEVLEGETAHWLHVLHRQKDGRDVFFIANQNHLGAPRKFRFRIQAPGVPECWDAMRNEITAVPFRRAGAQAEVTLGMQPNESVVLVFAAKKRALPARIEPNTGRPRTSLAVVRDPSPAQPEPAIKLTRRLDGCAWVWYPEGNPAADAPPGERYFRKQIVIPEDRKITKALFYGTADNSLTLFVNGANVGHGDDSANGWRNPVELKCTAQLHPGTNQLAILAINASDRPNPAGVIGRLEIEFEQGASLMVRVDQSWKASREKPAGWTEVGFNDTAWIGAKEVAPYGQGQWGQFGGEKLTLSPVKADPYDGHFEMTSKALTKKGPIYLELDEVAPEAAARVTVNGQSAGGFLGAPLRLDIAKFLKAGVNTIRIEPFAPKMARVVSYE
jgi:hypothetical protein